MLTYQHYVKGCMHKASYRYLGTFHGIALVTRVAMGMFNNFRFINMAPVAVGTTITKTFLKCIRNVVQVLKGKIT